MAPTTLIAESEAAQKRAAFPLSSVNAGKNSQRIPALDTLRGFLLLWMTLTHLPTRVSQYSNQAVGYVSAAEGFILLAAILVARIHQGSSAKYGQSLAVGKLWRRIARIYSYHVVLLGFAFFICGAIAAKFQRVPLENLLDYYLQHPKEALLAAPALLYNPPLLDILPMYIIFMLLTPLILRAAERWGWRAVLIVSGSVWVLAQFNLRAWVYAVAAHAGFPVPLNETGAFDLFGWQFLWTAGLWLGSARAASVFSKTRIPRWVLLVSAAVAAVMFILRHDGFDVLAGPTLFDALVNKWRLGIFRLIDAAAIGVLLVRFGSPLADTRTGARLAVLGRASLEVFSAHVVLCLVFLGLASGVDPHFEAWQDPIVVAVTIGTLFVVADWVERRRARRQPISTSSKMPSISSASPIVRM